MNNVQEAFKHNRARKHVIIGGMVILTFITLISCVSSFTIYRGGFSDMPPIFQNLFALFAVVIVEGAFIWLLYGFTRAFSSSVERGISLMGMAFIVGVMLLNIVTHFMMVKGIQLADFQTEWIDWGAVTVFIAVLLMVLFITLADPVIRLIRLELRYKGKQEEKILEAKTQGLDSEVIENAMAERASTEADQLATRILGQTGHLPRSVSGDVFPRALDISSRTPGPRGELVVTGASYDTNYLETEAHASSDSWDVAEGAKRLREALKAISFHTPKRSFKIDVKQASGHLWIRQVRSHHGTQETINSVKVKIDLLQDAIVMNREAFQAKLENLLRENDFEM